MEGPGSEFVAKKVRETEIADTPRLLEDAGTGSKKPKVLARRNKSFNPPAAADGSKTNHPSLVNQKFTETESDIDEIITRTETEKNAETKVRDSNLVEFLMAESDPVLIRILLDKSKPENLSVFLKNSSISLRDFG